MGVERDEVAEVVDPGTIDRIEAVVFDANAFGRDALLNLDLLRTWARDLKSADKQLWLPEPVLWELAAHTADVIDGVRGQLGIADRRIRQSGLEGPTVPAWGIREEIVSTLVDKVYEIDNLEVIECLDDDAYEALRDQITLRPPGKLKHDVKTGAADSAALRATRRHSGYDNSRYAIVSKDQDIRSAYTFWGEIPPPIFSHPAALREAIFRFGLAPADLARRASGFLIAMIRENRVASDLGFETATGTDRVLPTPAQVGDVDIAFEPIAEILRVTRLVGLAKVRVSESQDSLVLLAYLLSDARSSMTVYWADHDPVGRESLDIHNRVVCAPLVMTLGEGSILSAALEEQPWMMFERVTWTDPEEALEDCMDSLWNVPELQDVSLSYGGSTSWSERLSLDTRAAVDLEGGPERDGGWRLRATLGGATLTLRTVRGRRLGTWQLQVEGDEALVSNPSWALAEFLIRLRALPP